MTNFRLRLDEPSELWCVMKVDDGVALQCTEWVTKSVAVTLRYRLIILEEARQRAALKAVAAIGPPRQNGRRPTPLAPR